MKRKPLEYLSPEAIRDIEFCIYGDSGRPLPPGPSPLRAEIQELYKENVRLKEELKEKDKLIDELKDSLRYT